MTDLAPRFTPRERTVLVVLALYVAAVLVALTPIGGAFGGETGTESTGPPGHPIPEGTVDRGASDGLRPTTELGAPTQLQASDQLRANQIMASDRSLATALGGAPHSIVKSGPWTTSGADGSSPRVLGAAYVVTLDKPIALDSVKLPGALYDQTERVSPPYQSIVNTVSSSRVTEFLVLVDLARGKVVNISPGPGSQGVESTPPPGFERTVPVPREVPTP
jgi:hypothetical protein